jgi:hypothetical protein
MSYVVYNKQTTRIIGSEANKYWRTQAAALAHLTRMGKMGYRTEDYDVAEVEHFYNNIELKVTRKNYLTGEAYQESINTPLHCSPASESYWSM